MRLRQRIVAVAVLVVLAAAVVFVSASGAESVATGGTIIVEN